MELCRHAVSGNFISCSSYFVLVPKRQPPASVKKNLIRKVSGLSFQQK